MYYTKKTKKTEVMLKSSETLNKLAAHNHTVEKVF